VGLNILSYFFLKNNSIAYYHNMITKKSEHIGQVPNGTKYLTQSPNHSYIGNVSNYCNNFVQYLRGDIEKCGYKNDNQVKCEQSDPMDYKGCKVNIEPIGNAALTVYRLPIKEPVYYYIQPTFQPLNVPVISDFTFLNPTQLQPNVNDVRIINHEHYHYYRPRYQHTCHHFYSKSRIYKRNRSEHFYYYDYY
jgi:hypothetical protein